MLQFRPQSAQLRTLGLEAPRRGLELLLATVELRRALVQRLLFACEFLELNPLRPPGFGESIDTVAEGGLTTALGRAFGAQRRNHLGQTRALLGHSGFPPA